MPTYEYRCRECGEQLEVVQSFTDDPLTECPRCSGPLRKVFNSVGIAFKGSGFYKNDSRPSTKASNSKASDGKKEPESTSTPKSSSTDSTSSTPSTSSTSSPAATSTSTA